MRTTPIAGALGALIDDLDLTQPLDDATFAAVQDALHTHQVIFFRNQSLNLARHREFAARFGPIQTHPAYAHPDMPEMAVLEHSAERPSKIGEWHSDMTFAKRPPLGSILRGVKMPAYGGDTLWASQSAAFEALSDRWRGFVDGLEAVHDFRRGFRHSIAAPGGAERFAQAVSDNPPVVHPVVRIHPATGKKGLFVNQLFTTEIVGMTEAESEATLRFLYDHSTQPQFTCRFRWRDDSIAIWDSRSTQHRPVNDHGGQYRLLYRITIEGDRPV